MHFTGHQGNVKVAVKCAPAVGPGSREGRGVQKEVVYATVQAVSGSICST